VAPRRTHRIVRCTQHGAADEHDERQYGPLQSALLE
jgi:hypothetical protein